MDWIRDVLEYQTVVFDKDLLIIDEPVLAFPAEEDLNEESMGLSSHFFTEFSYFPIVFQ